MLAVLLIAAVLAASEAEDAAATVTDDPLLDAAAAAAAAEDVGWPRAVVVIPTPTMLTVLCIALVRDFVAAIVDAASVVPSCAADAVVETAAAAAVDSDVAVDDTRDEASSDVAMRTLAAEVLGPRDVPAAAPEVLFSAEVANEVEYEVPNPKDAAVVAPEVGLAMVDNVLADESDAVFSKGIVVVMALELDAPEDPGDVALLKVDVGLLLLPILLLLLLLKDADVAVEVILALTVLLAVVDDSDVCTPHEALETLLEDVNVDAGVDDDVETAAVDAVETTDATTDVGSADDIEVDVAEAGAVETGVEAKVEAEATDVNGDVERSVVDNVEIEEVITGEVGLDVSEDDAPETADEAELAEVEVTAVECKDVVEADMAKLEVEIGDEVAGVEDDVEATVVTDVEGSGVETEVEDIEVAIGVEYNDDVEA